MLRPWGRRALPEAPICDGQPVWQTPIFDYLDIIAETSENKKQTVLKNYGEDVVKRLNIWIK